MCLNTRFKAESFSTICQKFATFGWHLTIIKIIYPKHIFIWYWNFNMEQRAVIKFSSSAWNEGKCTGLSWTQCFTGKDWPDLKHQQRDNRNHFALGCGQSKVFVSYTFEWWSKIDETPTFQSHRCGLKKLSKHHEGNCYGWIYMVFQYNSETKR